MAQSGESDNDYGWGLGAKTWVAWAYNQVGEASVRRLKVGGGFDTLAKGVERQERWLEKLGAKTWVAWALYEWRRRLTMDSTMTNGITKRRENK